MEGIKTIGLSICLAVILLSYLKQLIPGGKSEFLMKTIISTYILLSLIIGFQRMDFEELQVLRDPEEIRKSEVWEQSRSDLERELKDSFQRFLNEQNENARVESVSVDFSGDRLQIRRVTVSGPDAETAKSLLAGRFGIGMLYIEVTDE